MFPMVKTTKGFIKLDDGKTMHYEVAGDGDVLVLGHAGFVDSRMWDAQWDIFAEKYRVIRFDMLGFGQSNPVTTPRTRRHDLAQLLDHLHVERAMLLGCSLGGEIVLDFALEQPERVLALIIVSSAPGGFQFQGTPPPLLLEMIAALQAGEEERASELQVRLWFDGSYRQPGQVDPQLRQRVGEMNLIPVQLKTWLASDSQSLNPLNPPAIQRLDTIQVPTLIMAGALDDAEILRAANVMEDKIKGAQKHILAHSAHLPNMEEAEEFTQVVLEFLAQNAPLS
jgi:pimeloyl-ACP methyl ester carboxylesterase